MKPTSGSGTLACGGGWGLEARDLHERVVDEARSGVDRPHDHIGSHRGERRKKHRAGGVLGGRESVHDNNNRGFPYCSLPA